MTRRFARTLTRTATTTTLAATLALGTLAATPARASDGGRSAVAAASLLTVAFASLIAGSHDLGAGPARPAAERAVFDGRGEAAPPQPVADPRKELPTACLFDRPEADGGGSWYGSRCLTENFVFWPYMPDRCETSIGIPGLRGEVRVYDAACLANFGYHTAGDLHPAYR